MKINFINYRKHIIKYRVYYFIFWIALGLLLSKFDTSLKYNYVYVIGVNILIPLEIYARKKIFNTETSFANSISGISVDNIPLNSIYQKSKRILTFKICTIISLIVGFIYFISLICLDVLKYDALITYYGMLTLIPAVFIAIKLYIKYVIYICMLKNLSNLKWHKFPSLSLLNPSETHWIKKISITMNLFSKYFAIIGLAYTLLFYLTTPLTAISLNDGILDIFTNNFVAFIITWFIIMIFICAGYFILNLLWKAYIKKIIRKIKANTLKKVGKQSTVGNINKDYLELFKIYKDTPDFPELFKVINIDVIATLTILLNIGKLIQLLIK